MFGPHTFRHPYATEFLHRGAAVEVVQHLLGHASIATTGDAYAHLTPGLVGRLAAVRPKFRAEVLVPAVGDPIVGSSACAVPGCAVEPLRRTVSGASGSVAQGWSPRAWGVGRQCGSRGDGLSAVAVVSGVLLWVRSASVSVVLQAFPRLGQGRVATGGSVEAGGGRGADGGVRGTRLRVVRRTGRGLV